MARHLDSRDELDHRPVDRRDYLEALLHHRRPHPVDDEGLLKRIESKTAQHRSPYSANISRKHASILSALTAEERGPARLGHRRSLTPTREASVRKAFEVFEWEREKEPFELEEAPEGEGEEEWSQPPEPRPALTKYLASLGEDTGPEPAEAGDEEPSEAEEPSEVEEAGVEVELDESILEDARAIMAAPGEGEEAPGEGEETPGDAEDTTGTEGEEAPEVTDEPPRTEEEEVVVEGRPGRPTREGGEFPSDLMEPLDEADTEGSAGLDLPRRGEGPTPTVSFERDVEFSEDSEAVAAETETEESVVGLEHAARWPSDTGLELHIDGFEHISATSDLCPRCGRRITARNRLLTCSDCGTVACETCEIKTSGKVDAPYYYDWRFELPLCVRCYEKALNIQKLLAKAKAAMGMGNLTYAFYHAQQALRTDPSSPYSEEAQRIISQIDRRRREAAEQDEAWKRQRAKLSRTTVVHED